MPNWCSNRVRIYAEGDKQEIMEFVNGNSQCFSFKSILPMPEALDEIIAGTCTVDGVQYDGYRYEIPPKKGETSGKGKKTPVGPKEKATLLKLYGAVNWYDWTNKHWGTKWDCHEPEIEDEYDDEVTYKFDTAWCPPKQICKALREKFPDASISWFWDEPGMEQAGYI